MFIDFDLITHPKYKYVLTSPYQHKLIHPIEDYSGIHAPLSADFMRRWPSAQSPLWVAPGPEDLPVVTFTGECLELASGYAWDGSTGPALDTVNFMRGSLVHDALYQVIAEMVHRGAIQHKGAAWWRLKRAADRELVAICAQDGMGWWRRQWVHAAVRLGGRPGERYQSWA